MHLPILAAALAAPRCYLDPVWATGENVTTTNLTYGSAFNNYTQEQQELLLDVYEASNDVRTKRPAVVLIHGGSFLHNNKSIYPITAIAAANRSSKERLGNLWSPLKSPR